MSPEQMPNPKDVYEAAAAGFRRAMSAVKEEQLSSSTPCTEWNVQALLNHDLQTIAFTQGVLSNNVSTDSPDPRGPLPSEGALAAFDSGISQVLDLLKAPGTMDKELDTPFGKMTGGQFLMVPFTDLLVHRWDLAKGTSQNTSLEKDLMEVSYSISTPELMEGARSGGASAAEVPVPEGASVQDKLIGLWGRNP